MYSFFHYTVQQRLSNLLQICNSFFPDGLREIVLLILLSYFINNGVIMADLIKTNIFDYTDYRTYLKDVHKANERSNSAVDFYGLLALEGGFSSKGSVCDIFNGVAASLSVMHCIQISKALAHSDEEAEYFRCLVALSQVSHDKEIRYFDDMRRRIADSNAAKTGMVDRKRGEFYTQWYHSVVRALISTVHASEDVCMQLEKKLLLPVSENQLQRSMELLFRLGFIKKGSNGDYLTATEKNIKTGQDFSWEEKKRIHLQYLKLAGDVLSEDGIGPTKVSSHVIGISGKTFEQICKYTDELKKRISTLVENEEKTDRVYLYQLVFVPLTRDCTTR